MNILLKINEYSTSRWLVQKRYSYLGKSMQSLLVINLESRNTLCWALYVLFYILLEHIFWMYVPWTFFEILYTLGYMKTRLARAVVVVSKERNVFHCI